MTPSPLRRFWANPLGKVAVIILLPVVLLSAGAYVWVPDVSRHGNAMDLTVALLPPGSRVNEVAMGPQPGRTLGGLLWGEEVVQRVIRVQRAWQSGDSLFYEGLGPHAGQTRAVALNGASWHLQSRRFLLGTDRFGRDYLSRLVIGGRVSLAVGFGGVLLSVVLGTLLGGLAGFMGGWVDRAFMWLMQVFWSIPSLLMALAVTLALGKGMTALYLAIGLTLWVEVARVVRGQVLGIKELEFVTAARVLGIHRLRILVYHILPQTWSTLIVLAAANFSTAILLESGLSFLGIGAQPPVPSWGGAVRDNYGFLIMDKAYLALLPGAFILVTVSAFMMAGQALRDALQTKQR
jgi:peptide/nickel transport system permease protein